MSEQEKDKNEPIKTGSEVLDAILAYCKKHPEPETATTKQVATATGVLGVISVLMTLERRIEKIEQQIQELKQ